MPEFVGLRSGTFSVPFTNDDQRRSLYALDIANGRTFFVNGRIVVDRRTKEGDHPLIDQVLAVVTLLVGDPSTGDGGAETDSLCDGPHRHVAAVTPTGHTQPCWIDGILGDGGIYSRENVTQIAAPKVFHISAGKLFSLTITPARIGKQNVVTA